MSIVCDDSHKSIISAWQSFLLSPVRVWYIKSCRPQDVHPVVGSKTCVSIRKIVIWGRVAVLFVCGGFRWGFASGNDCGRSTWSGKYLPLRRPLKLALQDKHLKISQTPFQNCAFWIIVAFDACGLSVPSIFDQDDSDHTELRWSPSKRTNQIIHITHARTFDFLNFVVAITSPFGPVMGMVTAQTVSFTVPFQNHECFKGNPTSSRT